MHSDAKFQTPKGPNLYHSNSLMANSSGMAALSTPEEFDYRADSTAKIQKSKHQYEQSDTKTVNFTAEKNPSSARPSCNCKKSKCLKLYCDCFAIGLGCGPDCNCLDCSNVDENDERKAAIDSILDRNPLAFQPKIQDKGTHAKGCHCKKSGCLKKYCECYQSGVACTDRCLCEGCKNCQDRLVKHDYDDDMKDEEFTESRLRSDSHIIS